MTTMNLEGLSVMKENCALAGKALAYALSCVKAGMTTDELDHLAAEWIFRNGGVPSFKGYRGYPKHICVSVNEEVVHGIPGARILGEGDLVSVDLGIAKGGWFSDVAATLCIGRPDPASRKLLEVTREAMNRGIAQAKAGKRVGDISFAIQSYVEGQGCSIVREYIGHGIGRAMHEDPQVPNFGRPGQGPALKPGMIICIEPMVSAGRSEVEVLPDGWTAVTKDRSRSAHFEHTVLITGGEPEILTRVGMP